MANTYKGRMAILDTFNANADICNLMFGDSQVMVNLSSVRIYNASQNDVFVLRDYAGNIVCQLKADTANQDLREDFGGNATYKSLGLKMLSADQTMNGQAQIVFE